MRPLAERLRYAENYCVLAKHQLENGKQEQALLSLRQALQLVPRHVAALASMVRLCYSRGELEQAQSYLQRWLAADGRDSECHFLYGNLCLGLQQYEQGLEHYQQARELGDDSPDLCFNQGLAHYLLGDLSGAERLFRQTLEADPGFARALDGLGCVARSRGRPEAATALFRQAVAADPTFLETLDHLVQVLIELGRLDKAQEALREALERQPGTARVWYLLGLVHCHQQSYGQAIRALEQAAKLAPQDEVVLCQLAAALRQAGQLDRALQAADRALATCRENPEARLERARVLAQCGRPQEALEELGRARELAPGNEEIAAALESVRRLLREG